MRQEIALRRWAVIAEAANARLASSERGAVVREIAAREHAHPGRDTAPVLAGHHRQVGAGAPGRRAGRAAPVAALGYRGGAGHAGAVR